MNEVLKTQLTAYFPSKSLKNIGLSDLWQKKSGAIGFDCLISLDLYRRPVILDRRSDASCEYRHFECSRCVNDWRLNKQTSKQK